MKPKKNYVPFIAGMACMVLLIGGVSGSLAAQDQEEAPKVTRIATADHPAGTIPDKALEKVYAGQAGVALFGKEQKAPGATRTNGAGTEVPTVLTYVDEKGNANYYVSAEQIVEMLDMDGGVTYNEELNCVDFGTIIREYVDEDQQEQRELVSHQKHYAERRAYDENGDELIIGLGDRKPEFSQTVELQDGSSIIIGSGGTSNNASRDDAVLSKNEEMREWQLQYIEKQLKQRRETSVTPEYGVSEGAYTEVNPSEIDRSTYLGSFLYQDVFQSDTKVKTYLDFAPYAGHYGLLTIENQGTDDVLVYIKRLYTIGGSAGYFSSVRVPKGATLERAFRVNDVDNVNLLNQLEINVESCDPDLPVQVRLTAEQYRSGMENGTK